MDSGLPLTCGQVEPTGDLPSCNLKGRLELLEAQPASLPQRDKL
jgi:hypothetical protein